MRSVLERVDAWCRRGDFTVEDLARYRIIYGLIALLGLSGYGGLVEQPEGQFDPPPGPIMLFDSIPPRMALEALEFASAVLVVFLIMGFKTKAASLLLAAAMMTGTGLWYSFGKIDHNIFVLLVPAAMAFSGWGGAMSVDAHLAARSGRPRIEASQWAVRLLAFMIGLAFLTAGIAKVRGGWLDIHTNAARGHFVHGYVSDGKHDYLAPLLIRIHDIGILWEAIDWFTVALECGLVVAVLWWRMFRIGIAFAALFHLGILLMMNIQFSANVIAYGAFMRWNLIAPSREGSVLPIGQPVAWVLGVGLGYGAYSVHNSDFVRFLPSIGLEMLYVGAAVALIYLTAQAWLVLRAMRRRVRPSLAA
jgi:uncharacterized membrane protein YphA (DoxX/SURF4 family)